MSADRSTLPNTYPQLVLLLCLIVALGCGGKAKAPLLPLAKDFRSYSQHVQPIFNRRCAVCHSCNDAPCQFDMTAFAGVDRGASAENVYTDRLFGIAPSRLFVDAKNTKEWRARGFFPVIRHHDAGDPRNLDESILYQLIEYRSNHKLPSMRFDAYSSRRCPDLRSTISWAKSEIAAIFKMDAHSDLGMPYGFPALTKEEQETIRDWLVRGAPGPAAALMPSENELLL